MVQYYLKYFAEIQNFRGQLTRVEIHQRDTAPDTVLQIGDVCGLELEIQGNTDDIFVPIIKTQARLSMVSSDDKPTSGGIKYGDWGEFCTPDATLYKFVLKTKPTAEASDWTTRWTGYITPDSWQEGLDYRSAITIIARDNIGHLQDFDFDMQPADKFGLASIRSILAAAMEKIDFPMDYITDSAPESIQADGTDILDALVLLSNFEGDNWYSVVEDILDSIGYTLRYTDNNRFTLAPVRYLPLLGEASESAQRENADLEFFGGTGEIVPAVKKIVEEVNYDYESEVPLRINAEHLWTAEKTYHCIISSSVTGKMPFIDSQNAKYRNLTTNDWTVWKAGSSGNDVADLWKPGKPSIVTLTMEGENWNNYVFLAANGVESDRRTQAMKFKSATSDLTIRFYFHRHPVSILEDPTQTQLNGAVVLGDIFGRAGLAEVEYIVKITDGSGIIRFWNDKTKEWGDTSVTNEQEYEPENLTTDVSFILGQCPDITGECTIEFTFVHIAYMLTTPLYILSFNGCYARLSNVTIESNAVNLKSNTIRTINDEKYNVLINRKPSVAPLSRQVSYTHPANYPSALFYLSGSDYLPKPFPYEGNWSNISRVTKPLPVLIHQQLLCYRGANLWQVSGECAPKERRLLFFDTIVRYKNRRYIIQAGTMDFMTGTFVSATLREFLEYDDIWDDRQQGDWSDTSKYNTIGGEVSGSGGSGAGAGSTGYYGGGGVNYFEEDGNGGIKLKDKYAGLWVPGYLANGGIGSGDDGEISGEKTFLDIVTFADETLFEEASVFEAGLTSMGISIANVASYRRINCAADRLYIQQSVSQDLVLTNGNNSHTIVGGYVSPGSYKFYVNGTARASSWDTSSDCRLKDKIEDVCSDRALAVLMAIRPKEWIWNEKNDYLCGRRGAGLVAQDVQNVLPFAVNESGDYLSLNYTILHAYQIAGWQNHEARIAELEKKISHA